jgi:transcriptional regulator NrdR family protein
MKMIEINFEVPEVCPHCKNPNSNIDGSLWGKEKKLSLIVKCMSCGRRFHTAVLNKDHFQT